MLITANFAFNLMPSNISVGIADTISFHLQGLHKIWSSLNTCGIITV